MYLKVVHCCSLHVSRLTTNLASIQMPGLGRCNQPAGLLKMHFVLGLVMAMSTFAAALWNYSDFEAGCLAFQPERSIWNSTRTQLQFVPAGTNLTFPDHDITCNRNSQVVSVDLCRIALSVPTSNRSSITLELWLPETWSGRTLATGNGGIDGCTFFRYIYIYIYIGPTSRNAKF